MRRLVIFQNYSFFDQVEKYTIYLLKSFKEIADKLIVLSNSKLKVEEKKIYQDLSDEYFERENIGYDAGAYKEFFQSITNNELSQWDEIVLANSTFFGPIYSWENVFAIMDKVECEFWGLSRHIGGGELPGTNYKIPPHVQSFFIVIKKEILNDNRFYEFWTSMEYPKSYQDAIINFEFGFTQYLCDLGYRYSTYLDQSEKGNELINAGGVVFTDKHYELIRQCGFPVVKYKYMDVCHYKQAVDILNYIHQNTEYDSEIIYNYIERLERWGIFPFEKESILNFVKKYPEIYIIGHGIYAKNIEFFLNENGYKVRNFIVSRLQNDREIFLNDLDNLQNKGFIVALGEKAFLEMREFIVKNINQDNLLLPN